MDSLPTEIVLMIFDKCPLRSVLGVSKWCRKIVLTWMIPRDRLADALRPLLARRAFDDATILLSRFTLPPPKGFDPLECCKGNVAATKFMCSIPRMTKLMSIARIAKCHGNDEQFAVLLSQPWLRPKGLLEAIHSSCDVSDYTSETRAYKQIVASKIKIKYRFSHRLFQKLYDASFETLAQYDSILKECGWRILGKYQDDSGRYATRLRWLFPRLVSMKIWEGFEHHVYGLAKNCLDLIPRELAKEYIFRVLRGDLMHVCEFRKALTPILRRHSPLDFTTTEYADLYAMSGSRWFAMIFLDFYPDSLIEFLQIYAIPDHIWTDYIADHCSHDAFPEVVFSHIETRSEESIEEALEEIYERRPSFFLEDKRFIPFSDLVLSLLYRKHDHQRIDEFVKIRSGNEKAKRRRK
jgi:hypothetical protein